MKGTKWYEPKRTSPSRHHYLGHCSIVECIGLHHCRRHLVCLSLLPPEVGSNQPIRKDAFIKFAYPRKATVTSCRLRKRTYVLPSKMRSVRLERKVCRRATKNKLKTLVRPEKPPSRPRLRLSRDSAEDAMIRAWLCLLGQVCDGPGGRDGAKRLNHKS